MSLSVHAQACVFSRFVERLRAGQRVHLADVAADLGLQPAAARVWFRALRDETGAAEETDGRQKVLVLCRPPHTSLDRAMGLSLAVEALRPLTGSAWHDELVRMRDAHVAALDLPHVAAELSDCFAVVPAGRPVDDTAPVVRALLTAWRERRAVRLRYQKVDRTQVEREVEPCGLLLRGDHALLVARRRGARGAPDRNYRVDRILTVESLDDGRFTRPDAWRVDTLLADSWGVWVDHSAAVDVVVRVRGAWYGILERFQLHHSQRVEADGDAAIIHWTVRLCPELEAFLVGLLPDVEVLAPPQLAARLHQRVEALTAAAGDRRPDGAAP